jgi:hypothetical protein
MAMKAFLAPCIVVSEGARLRKGKGEARGGDRSMQKKNDFGSILVKILPRMSVGVFIQNNRN